MLADASLEGSLTPRALHPRARIFAQGRLVEAQQCRLDPVRQTPGNTVYRRSLDYVTRDLHPPRLPTLLLSTLVVIGSIVLLLVVV